MSAQEACTLILSTLLLDTAPIYFFKMGDPVRIAWLAEQLIHHYRPGADPSPLIHYSGIRPGEKLKEQLWDESEEPVPTSHPHIMGLTTRRATRWKSLEAHLSYLESLARRNEPASLRQALFEIPPSDAPGHLVPVTARR